MSGKPAARVTDPTACPVPGHGTNPITAGSPDVLFDNLPVARQGDPTACGSALAGNVMPNVLINGMPATTLGSIGSHGNVVIGGSGSVVVGNSHTPAPFTPPTPLASAASATQALAPSTPSLPQGPADTLARTWQEEPGDPAPLGLEEEDEEEELEEQVQQGITLRIGVFFDGTGNNLANAAVTEQCRRDDRELLDESTLREIVEYCEAHGFTSSGGDSLFDQAPDNSYGNAPSNVARLYDLYRDDSGRALEPSTATGYLKAYLEGIGTSSGEADSLYSQATGQGDTGVVARVEQSPAEIQKQLVLLLSNNPILQVDSIEFDIFGFSRGAAAARHFANELLKPEGGLLAQLFQAGAAGLSEQFDWAAHSAINFIGLFDTVAAVVDPAQGDLSPANNHNPGVNLYLPPGCARKVLQLVARDEQRWNFALNSVAPAHQEISLPGVHSDIGGGYRPLMLERCLLSRPRRSIVHTGVANDHTVAARETWRDYHAWEARGLPGQGLMRPRIWRKALPYDRRSGGEREDAVYATLPIERRVRGELSLVYLRVMRELAVQHNVPLLSIPDTPQFAIPADLGAIADKLLAYALGSSPHLTADDERLLWARYIHLSAHWTPSNGLLLNKPAPNRRLAYNNKPQEGYPQ
ncbi:putative Zn-binding protein involved in type VI secretion [Pseudomonas sp. SJZ079]|uniref:phospholipase effector Tle1 domain-containing protein n=1 Tax=Pseudomonas sp. SJZ079 TaxID=2572887 RepID=UPI0011991E95|nr:DUF2235 domain-containing protein [Pseudomonas sp. SJZ079]TWC37700.1 putative Zn-binding protein involved in type VI secretion [Pseudomonas sp. SJZ079]